MSQVIINDVPPYTQAIATGGQTVYSTNWTANYPSDVIVYSRASGVDADDLTQQVPYPSGYSVAFIGDLQEVQVTLTTPSTLGDIVTITRQTPADRENLYTNTNFLPSMLNNDFGILTLVDQQNQLVNQMVAPRYNYSAIINPNISFPTADTILPILAANQFWVKNNAGTEIIATTLPSSGIAPLNATYLTATNQVSVLPNSFQLLAGTNVTLTPGVNTLTVSVTGQAINPGTINNLGFYAATGSVISPLATGNNGVLVTSNSGVPSISSILPLGLTIPSPIIIGSNGFNVATFSDVALATDYFNFGAGTVNASVIQLISSQANASFSILAKGAGGVLVGSSSNTSTVPFGMYNGTNKFEFSIPTWTTNRTITLRDLSGTLAYLSDISSTIPVTSITGLGTGVATALQVNVGSSGAFVTFNGAGGTPSSMIGTNITGTAAGLTAGSASSVALGGITGLGTGVATALAINTGSAGAFITFNGNAGTPSALVGTNITGTAAGLTAGTASAVAVGGITGLGSGVATALALAANGAAGAFPMISSGSWTPIDSSGASLSFTGVSGSYVRIGNVVIAVCGLTYPSTASGSTAIIGGLPFTSATNQGGTVNYSNSATLSRILADSGATTFHMYTATSAAITNANMSGSVNIFQIIYTI
jgi:hypothetical protein